MKTIKSFVNRSYINEKLIRAVIRQCGGWDSFKEMAKDVYSHGADSGFSGFIYYTENTQFYKKNKAAILECAKQLADDIGENLYNLIASFRCFNNQYEYGDIANIIHNPKADALDKQIIFNALAWFALEEVSRSYCELLEG